MIKFFDHFKIKHRDFSFILTYLFIFVLIVLCVSVFFSLVTVVLVGTLLLAILGLILAFHFYRANEALYLQQQQKYQAYFSLYNLIEFRLPPPYMTGWAATPELALSIFETIKVEKPEDIVELGSGISSLICAYAMEQNGTGVLYSLDHNQKYGNKTKVMLAQHKTDKRVIISHAPLKSQIINNQNCIWYDCSEAKFPETIDLLIVDGPPFETQKKARYPALPYFLPKLSPSATIIIHDAFRKAETAIVNEWVRDHPEFSRELINSEKGIAVLKR